MPNKVVVRYLDGRTERGSTSDFMPHKDMFHIVVEKAKDRRAIPVKMTNLKAVFFVKELGGRNRERPVTRKSFDDIKDTKLIGRKVKVTFLDGEELLGLTLGYSPQRRGFFFTPIDQESNNERVFAVMSAIKDISFYD